MEVAIIGWIILAAVSGYFATSRGRNGAGWFLLSVLISPILCIILIAILGDLNKTKLESTTPTTKTNRKSRKCPFCAEEILAEAIRCKHCGSNVEPIVVIDPNETNEQKAERFGIRRDSGQYIYGKFRYQSIDEAIAAAETDN